MKDANESRKIAEIPPQDAWKILESDEASVLLDVRSRVEFDYVGHPPGAVNVPWQDAPAWKVDPDFLEKVRDSLARLAGPAVPVEQLTVLAICRSGSRSREAAERLAAGGFKKVINVAEGFEGKRDANKHRGNINGWRYHGLPWEQT